MSSQLKAVQSHRLKMIHKVKVTDTRGQVIGQYPSSHVLSRNNEKASKGYHVLQKGQKQKNSWASSV